MEARRVLLPLLLGVLALGSLPRGAAVHVPPELDQLWGLRKSDEGELLVAAGAAYTMLGQLLGRMAVRTSSRKSRRATRVEAGRLVRFMQGVQAVIGELKLSKKACSTCALPRKK